MIYIIITLKYCNFSYSRFHMVNVIKTKNAKLLSTLCKWKNTEWNLGAGTLSSIFFFFFFPSVPLAFGKTNINKPHFSLLMDKGEDE